MWMKLLLASGAYFDANNDGGTGGGGGEGGDNKGGGEGNKDDKGKGGEGGKKEGDDKKPTDAEAKLLKEVMGLRAKIESLQGEADTGKKAKSDLDALTAQISEVLGEGGVAKLKETLDATAAAEEKRQREAGEWDALKERLVTGHTKALADLKTAHDTEMAGLKASLQGAQKQIRKLTVGAAFATSKYRGEEMTLSAGQAERLYGQAFKVEFAEDGTALIKAFRGKEPLVGQDGQPLSFDAALKELVEADPDHKSVLRLKDVGGAGSHGSNGGGADTGKDEPKLWGVSRIAASRKKEAEEAARR